MVVGGSGGIGEAVVELLAERGSDVVFTYHSNREKAAAIAERLDTPDRRVLAHQLRAEDPSQCRELARLAVETCGGIHSVVYAAGPSLQLKYVSEITPEEWAGVCDSDVNGCFNVVWSTLPELRRHAAGAFVAVTTSAVQRSPVQDVLSAAPKAAVEALVRALAKEEGRHGVRANCVEPGWVDAGMGKRMMAEAGNPDLMELSRKAIPLKRFGDASEVAAAVVFLLSPEGAYITGQFVAVDGGMQL